jgi:biopolymer transport protein ExbB
MPSGRSIEISRSPLRWLRLALLVFVASIAFGTVSSPAIAQDDAADAAPAVNEAPAEADTQESSVAKPSKNMLVWTFQALGITYSVVFLAISMTLFALIVTNILAVRRESICPNDVIDGVEQSLSEGNPAAAAEIVRNDESFLGQVVTAGLGKLEKGFERSIEAMQEVGEEETMKVEHRLSYLALIGNIAPMVGLLGTVQGMIKAFTVIAQSDSTPKPSELAVGISTALFTTLVGLMIAIPAIAIYNILRNRSQKLVLEVGNTSEEMLEKFQDAIATT